VTEWLQVAKGGVMTTGIIVALVVVTGMLAARLIDNPPPDWKVVICFALVVCCLTFLGTAQLSNT
jgi:hypothetical protein